MYRNFGYENRPYNTHFVSPDTLIPDPYNVLVLNRYGYARYNPLKYVDPSGYSPDCWDDGYACGDDPFIEYDNPWETNPEPIPYDPQDNNGHDNREQAGDFLSDVTFGSDALAMAISYGEMWFVDGIGIILIGGGFVFGGPGLALTGAEATWLCDTVIAGPANPIALLETSLGYISLVATVGSDIAYENTSITNNGLYVGADTLVAFRNALLGTIPEAHVDAFVSRSQFEYNIARREGEKPSRSIQPFSIDALLQLIWNDWIWW